MRLLVLADRVSPPVPSCAGPRTETLMARIWKIWLLPMLLTAASHASPQDGWTGFDETGFWLEPPLLADSRPSP